jgi:asparagine synthase (glutamine-hydrolysing)
MAQRFFGRKLEEHARPGFGHEPRWHTTSALKRLFSGATRDAVGSRDAAGELLASLPPELAAWSPLAQDQYLEMRTLLASYILCSQGDRMLMAHSVEGRFPFLDKDVVALAASLPASYKLRVLDEKHVLKRAAAGLVPEEILRRPKQPYRAPDALSFVGEGAPAWIELALSEAELRRTGVFEPRAVAALFAKCRAWREGAAPLSNTDNMALVGVVSTQLLHSEILDRPSVGGAPDLVFATAVDRASA